MHDINTINRVNYEAFARAIQNFQAQGRFVLATYEGLTLTTIESFSSANEMVDAHHAAIQANPATTGTNFKCFQPTAGFHAATRDQSEDRRQQLSPAEDKTLGDYISRKGA
jgi:hypothetical protein